MKKAYIKPQTTTLEIETEQLMAASPSFDNGTGSVDVNSVNANNEAMSKGHTFDLWADDEE